MNINFDIARTYLIHGRKQTFVAVLGVVLGVALYLFMNCMSAGFDRSANESFFKSTAHLRIYKEELESKPLFDSDSGTVMIVNPRIVPITSGINDPKSIVEMIERKKEVKVVVPQVSLSSFYNIGKSQMNGKTVGLDPSQGDEMFNISSFMVQGSVTDLSNNPNGILIGSGIADRLSIEKGDVINVSSSRGVSRVLNVVGIFQTNNKNEDKSKSYVNTAIAQQLLKEGPSYVSDINVNFHDFNDAVYYSREYSDEFGYKAEDWKTANEAYVAASKMRLVIITFISFTLLLISCFGIYNILNMTVSQKINEIAILKATGFRGKDVIQIFVTQAMTVGLIGVVLGIFAALLLIQAMKHYYIGGDIGYFPIRFEGSVFIRGILIGLTITFFAGYIPARKAAKVDPVSIFRK